jgi:hypothetical protein
VLPTRSAPFGDEQPIGQILQHPRSQSDCFGIKLEGTQLRRELERSADENRLVGGLRVNRAYLERRRETHGVASALGSLRLPSRERRLRSAALANDSAVTSGKPRPTAARETDRNHGAGIESVRSHSRTLLSGAPTSLANATTVGQRRIVELKKPLMTDILAIKPTRINSVSSVRQP